MRFADTAKGTNRTNGTNRTSGTMASDLSLRVQVGTFTIQLCPHQQLLHLLQIQLPVVLRFGPLFVRFLPPANPRKFL